MKLIKVFLILVFIIILKNIIFCDFFLLLNNVKNCFLENKKGLYEANDFRNYLNYIDKNISKKQDIYFSLPSQYHQLLANYYLYPRRIYVDPRDIMWTNTIVSYETIPNIIYILEGSKTKINNLLWISGGEGIEGILMSKKDILLARVDFLISTDKWHKPGAIVLEIYDNGKLLKKISNEKILEKAYKISDRYMKNNEEEILSSSKFIINPPIQLTTYKEYGYKLYFRGDTNDTLGLSQEVEGGEVGTKKLMYQLHPYYKLYKSYGLNKNIYNRG